MRGVNDLANSHLMRMMPAESIAFSWALILDQGLTSNQTDSKNPPMTKRRPMTAKKNIRVACGMLQSKTSVIKALLKERARDKKREAAKLKKRGGR